MNHLSNQFQINFARCPEHQDLTALKRLFLSIVDVRNFESVATALNNVDLVIHTSIIQIPQIIKKRTWPTK
jgi:hypothetical protein